MSSRSEVRVPPTRQTDSSSTASGPAFILLADGGEPPPARCFQVPESFQRRLWGSGATPLAAADATVVGYPPIGGPRTTHPLPCAPLGVSLPPAADHREQPRRRVES